MTIPKGFKPWLKIITKGCTRLVVLIGPWAFKLPRFDLGWKMGLHGLLANMQEHDFAPTDPLACPVSFYLPGGWLSVMPRCIPLTDEEWDDVQHRCPGSFLPIPVEYRKRDSFGTLNGRVVAVDYGS
jgi:hypothetical protein